MALAKYFPNDEPYMNKSGGRHSCIFILQVSEHDGRRLHQAAPPRKQQVAFNAQVPVEGSPAARGKPLHRDPDIPEMEFGHDASGLYVHGLVWGRVS